MSDLDDFLGKMRSFVRRLKDETDDLRPWLDGMTDDQLKAEKLRLEEAAEDAAYRADVIDAEIGLRAISSASADLPRSKIGGDA